MTVNQLRRALDALGPDLGECPVVYDDNATYTVVEGLMMVTDTVNFPGVNLLFLDCVPRDPSETRPMSSSSAADLVVAVLSLPVDDPLGWLDSWSPCEADDEPT